MSFQLVSPFFKIPFSVHSERELGDPPVGPSGRLVGHAARLFVTRGRCPFYVLVLEADDPEPRDAIK